MSPKVLYSLSLVCVVSGFQMADAFVSRSVPHPSGQLQARVATSSALGQIQSPSGSSLPQASFVVQATSAGGSLRELAAACEKSGTPAESRLALMEAISMLKPDELAAMLAKETSNTDFYRSSRFDFQFAARRLSEIAPEKAADLWLKARASHYGVDSLLAPWARKNPQAFASWSASLPADAQKAAGTTMAAIAAENPAEFSAVAAQLARSSTGVAGAKGAIAGMIAKAAKGDDPSNAIAYAQGLPEGPARIAALAAVARWPGMDLAAHPEVAAALAQLPPEEGRRYLQQVSGAADVLPRGPLRDSAYASQFTKAAQKDVQAAARRVEALAGSPDYPSAVRGFVEATAAKDPAAALEWALTISQTGTQRSAALERAAAELFRVKPAEARKWVERAPLSAEEYLMLTGRTR